MTATSEEVFLQNPALWKRLDRLRQIFLEREKDSRGAEAYWSDSLDLLAYDLSFARRIANKWESVLERIPPELREKIVSCEWIDWGCGSGVAAETTLKMLGVPKKISLWDHSSQAIQFSKQKLLSMGVESVEELKNPLSDFSGKVVLLSHLVNELKDGAQVALLEALKKAEVVIWVEAGSRETSQRLSRSRDRLLGLDSEFEVVLPCPHRNPKCPLSKEDAQDWCHFFADVKSSFHRSAFWREFSERIGVDLRSLPFSVLVLKKGVEEPRPETWHRVLGTTRVYKGFLKVQSCNGREGVREYILPKRVDKALFKRVKNLETLALFNWELGAAKDAGKVKGGQAKIVSGNQVGSQTSDDLSDEVSDGDDTE